MALTVNTNIAALSAARQLGETNANMSDSLARISSGMRITKAADDAAGLGVSTNLETTASSARQGIRNANDGISVIQTAEGASNEIVDLLQRMRELAVQGSSETLGTTERGYLTDELTALSEEIERLATATEFSGIALADGVITQMSIQVGAANATTSRITIDLVDLTASGLSVDVSASDVAVSTAALAQASIDTIDTALDAVNGARSGFGAAQNRLDSAITSGSVYAENLDAARSRISDVDYATETANLTKNQIMQQAGVAALAQAKGINSAVVSLLM
jgi:flagellin